MNRIKTLLISALLLIVFGCTPVENTVGPEICYRKLDENSIWQLYTDKISGGEMTNISNKQINDAYSPLWSADGKYIAYRNDREDVTGCDLYVYDIENDIRINLTSEYTANQSATPRLWTSDGGKIIYYYHEIGEPHCYYAMNADGTNKRELLCEDDIKVISFCDNDQAVLYTKEQKLYKVNIDNSDIEMILDLSIIGNYNIWVDAYDDLTETILCRDDSSRWDPGASFTIKTVGLHTQEIDTLIEIKDNSKIISPSWSNDRNMVAYFEVNYERNIDKLIIIENKDTVSVNTISNENTNYGSYGIKFSPLDNFILYTTRVITNDTTKIVDYSSFVYILNILNKNNNLISEASDPQWNPSINK
jgi:dipeptidyl aminopeptidase/acylaminoacyl peptidase